MSIAINPSLPLIVAQGVSANIALQPGTVIAARVLQVLGNDQLQIAIGGQAIDVQSQVPLQAGQTLQLAVSQTADGIRLAVVNPQGGASAGPTVADLGSAAAVLDFVTLAPAATAGLAAPTTPPVINPANQLTPLQTLAVSLAAQTAATQQTGLAPLFANLDVAAGLSGLPPQVQAAVAQLLTQRTSLDQNLTGDAIKQAFQSSGLFLEASLASGSPSGAGGTPDLKAALIVLRQVLATSLDDVTAAPQAAPATPSAAPEPAATVQTGVSEPGATSTAAAAQIATPIAQGTTPGVTVQGQGAQPSVQAAGQPIIIVVEPETLTTASLAPLLASEVAAPGVAAQGAAPTAAQEILDLNAAIQFVASGSTPSDAALRAAAGSATLSLLQEAVQAAPLTAANPSALVFENSQMLALVPALGGARNPAIDDAEFARTSLPPPPVGGALPAAQSVMPATLVSNSTVENAMHRLLSDTDGAIARQTLLQVASLPGQTDTSAGRIDPMTARWNFEIPFATPQGTAMAQFEISRDGAGGEVNPAQRIWRARFTLDVEPAGPVHALVSLNGERTSVRMWAERPATAAQLRAGAAQLSQALSRAELQPGDIVIRDGAPVQAAPAPAGHFLDRAL